MQDLALVLVIFLILVLIWRGPKTLPQLGAALGRGVKEARKEAGALREKPSDEDGGEDGDSQSAG